MLSVVSASCPTAVARPLHKGRGGGGATGRRPYNPPSPFQGQNHEKLPTGRRTTRLAHGAEGYRTGRVPYPTASKKLRPLGLPKKKSTGQNSRPCSKKRGEESINPGQPLIQQSFIQPPPVTISTSPLHPSLQTVKHMAHKPPFPWGHPFAYMGSSTLGLAADIPFANRSHHPRF